LFVKGVTLPNSFKRISFEIVGTDNWLRGKVLTKHKNKSIYKNIVGISLDDGTVEEYYFSKDIDEWEEENTMVDEDSEPSCSVLHTTILTKAQGRKRPGLKEAMQKEIKKFESFEAFKRVKDTGQPVIKTRWVYSEGEITKGETLKARLCMRGDTEENIETIRADSLTANKDSLFARSIFGKESLCASSS
jgi:hypothetical protein